MDHQEELPYQEGLRTFQTLTSYIYLSLSTFSYNYFSYRICAFPFRSLFCSSCLFFISEFSLLGNFCLCLLVALSEFVTMPSRYPGALTQDWEPVVLHKNRTKVQDRDRKAVNQALRTGAAVQTVKKAEAGSNKKAAPVVNAKKLDEAAEPAPLDRVSTGVKQLIQKARLEKKMSQAELAKQINERPQVVQEYENGKAVPNQAVLAKMERVLGVKLRGKIGK